MDVIITGAGGFIGSNLSKSFAEKGHRVFAYYRKSTPKNLFNYDNVILRKIDLINLKTIDHHADALIHCAADQPETCSNISTMLESNITGTEALFEAAYDTGLKIFIYLSSMAVYGKINVPVVDEKTMIDRPDEYGLSKLKGEKILELICKRDPLIKSIILRLPSIVGKGSHSNFLSNILKDILNDRKITIKNPNAHFNNAVYIGDLIDFLCSVLNNLPNGKNVFTISSAGSISLIEMINNIYHLTKRNPQISIIEPNGNSFMVSNDKIESLGFYSRPISETINLFVKDNLL